MSATLNADMIRITLNGGNRTFGAPPMRHRGNRFKENYTMRDYRCDVEARRSASVSYLAQELAEVSPLQKHPKSRSEFNATKDEATRRAEAEWDSGHVRREDWKDRAEYIAWRVASLIGVPPVRR